jgi:DNA-binding response OmpR family regulator
MNTILICDDEQDIINALKIYLANPDYVFIEAKNGRDALELIRSNNPDLVLLDLMMPVMDGITTLSKIREFSNVPVIILTAKSENTDKILGLDVGADDYITKPFVPTEVAARVRSQLRRYKRFGGDATLKTPGIITVGGIELDDDSKIVKVDGEEVSLTPKEYEILKLLMQNPGKVFSPKDIYKSVWQDMYLLNDNTVAVHVRHLREKIEINPAEPRYLKVIFGQGYKICANDHS